MSNRSVWAGLAAIVVIGALGWWVSTRGPGEAASTPAPGSASDTRASTLEPSAPRVAPPPTVATDKGEPVQTGTSPEAPSPGGPMRLAEDLLDSPGGGAVREPEATSTELSGGARPLRLPESRPPTDDGRPLRGHEAPLPGLPPAADPAVLPSRPPEDQGATSTR